MLCRNGLGLHSNKEITISAAGKNNLLFNYIPSGFEAFVKTCVTTKINRHTFSTCWHCPFSLWHINVYMLKGVTLYTQMQLFLLAPSCAWQGLPHKLLPVYLVCCKTLFLSPHSSPAHVKRRKRENPMHRIMALFKTLSDI